MSHFGFNFFSQFHQWNSSLVYFKVVFELNQSFKDNRLWLLLQRVFWFFNQHCHFNDCLNLLIVFMQINFIYLLNKDSSLIFHFLILFFINYFSNFNLRVIWKSRFILQIHFSHYISQFVIKSVFVSSLEGINYKSKGLNAILYLYDLWLTQFSMCSTQTNECLEWTNCYG